jgi:mercuric ion transport protein
MMTGYSLERRQRDETITPAAAPAKGALAGLAVLGALAASSCCLAPLALFLIGVSGAWIGNLTALAAYQSIFVGLTLACLAGGFVMVYRKPKEAACVEGSYCARPASGRIAKAALWTAALLVAAALVFPYAAGWLL